MAQTTLQDTRFKQMPTPEDLFRMSRDLRYHPVRNDHPAVLTGAQIDTFNEQGYLKPFRIYSNEEIGAIRDEFDGMIEQVMARGDHNYSIISAHLKSGMVHDIMNEPRIVAYISDLLGDDVVGWGAHFFCKLPGDGKIVNWHQDASFWPLSPSKTVTAWLAIDDADTGNACMRFVAGSHHYGHLTYHMSEEAENNVLNQTVKEVGMYGTEVDIELKAGEISLHSDLLLHGSGLNSSDRRRCGLTLRFCAASVRAELNWNKEGVIVKGSDPTDHWANLPRPAVDNV
ncbi:MAG: phytanoyl-CoA dioxygenase family protein [Gemmatimonadetes bacterium]|nr:phytanoyl-CoA dioxygenase family protein [Gemmatimonadota bacterium]MYJ89103.1 phytanoyl-CoA dioxygenase family protein [Gemmatimonadota bacterium]